MRKGAAEGGWGEGTGSRRERKGVMNGGREGRERWKEVGRGEEGGREDRVAEEG